MKDYRQVDFEREIYRQIDAEEVKKNMENIIVEEWKDAWDAYDRDKNEEVVK